MKVSLLVLSCLFSTVCAAVDTGLTERKNLREEWQVHSADDFLPFADGVSPSVIYFVIDPLHYKGDHLFIQSHRPFNLLINGKLIDTNKSASLLSLDSLGASYGKLNFAIYQHPFVDDLITRIVTKTSATLPSHDELESKPATHFRDFVVITFMLLIVFFLILFRLNPKLTLDYFSVRRTLLLRESDDQQAYSRIISISILFYLLASFCISLFLLIIVRFAPDEYYISIAIPYTSFITIILYWLKVSLIVFSIILVKSLLVHGLAYLFGFSEVSSFHYFNFTRILLILFFLVTVTAVMYYLAMGNSPTLYTTLFQLIRYIMFFWIGLMFLKLGHRLEFSRFHLFSYLCATEILPLLVIAKVLYE
jgi:hypothetical protein